jgi:hypothetical protein
MNIYKYTYICMYIMTGMITMVMMMVRGAGISSGALFRRHETYRGMCYGGKVRGLR